MRTAAVPALAAAVFFFVLLAEVLAGVDRSVAFFAPTPVFFVELLAGEDVFAG